MSAAAGPLLRLEGVTKRYGDAEILRGIDLDVQPHEVVCPIGASGSGKWTLLNCAKLIEHVSGGGVVVRG